MDDTLLGGGPAKTMAFIDITVPLWDGIPIWPGDPDLQLRWHKSLDAGDRNNVTAASFGLHTGTHVDGPNHFLRGGTGIESLSLETLVGAARVIEIEDPNRITHEELKHKNLSGATRFLIKTRNSSQKWWERPFDPDFCHMTRGAVKGGLKVYRHGGAIVYHRG